MDFASLARAAYNAAAVAIPALAPAVIPADHPPSFGPATIEVVGVTIPIASVALSMFGLAMARGVSAAREGPTPGGRYLTGVLVMIVLFVDLEWKPTPGFAILWGIGIGASGIVLYDRLRDWVIGAFDKVFPRKGRDGN